MIVDASKFGGQRFEVPVGCMPLINVAGIGHDPSYWIPNYDISKHGNVNMDQVHFEFWIDDNGNFSKKQNSDNFFAFHVGKRDCIGQSLAMKELIIVLAMIFMKYKVISPDGSTDFDISTKFTGTVVEPTIEDIRMILRE